MNTKLRCAVLDDYQNVALTSADWGPLMDQVEIQTFNNYMARKKKSFRNCRILILWS